MSYTIWIISLFVLFVFFCIICVLLKETGGIRVLTDAWLSDTLKLFFFCQKGSYLQFYSSLPPIIAHSGCGSWNLQLLAGYSSYVPYSVTQKKMVMDEVCSSTDDERRTTPTYSNGSPEWLIWSGIKNIKCNALYSS